jgi:Flp pilus assembly pilin Flp
VIRYAIELLRSLVKSERGQDVLEYAMLSGLLAIVLLALLATGVLQDAVTAMAQGISNCIDFDKSTTCAAGF